MNNTRTLSIVRGRMGEMAKSVVTTAAALAMVAGAGMANAALISLVPTPDNQPTGAFFDLTLRGSGFTDAGGGTVGGGISLIKWDAGEINLLGVTLLPGFDDIAAGGGFGHFGGSIDNLLGEAHNLWAIYNGVTDLQTGSDFDIATLHFQAGPATASTTVALTVDNDAFIWADSTGLEQILPTATNGLVNVQAVPVPAAVWLFASGLLGLVGVARRKGAA